MKIGLLLLLIVCMACTGHVVSSPIYAVSYGHDKRGEIKVSSEGNTALIEVSSAFGIGSGTINLLKGKWPERIFVRLKLKGLEGFSVSNGIIELEKSDLFVQAFSENGTALTDSDLQRKLGYYQVQLPKSLFVESTTSIALQWVDFYR